MTKRMWRALTGWVNRKLWGRKWRIAPVMRLGVTKVKVIDSNLYVVGVDDLLIAALTALKALPRAYQDAEIRTIIDRIENGPLVEW